MPSLPHAAVVAPLSCLSRPELSWDWFLLITPSIIGRDESENGSAGKASAQWSASPAEKCSKEPSWVGMFRPGT